MPSFTWLTLHPAVLFYGDSFGIRARFVHEGGDYAELETGETTLALSAMPSRRPMFQTATQR